MKSSLAYKHYKKELRDVTLSDFNYELFYQRDVSPFTSTCGFIVKLRPDQYSNQV